MPKNVDKYTNERQIILEKIFDILEINKVNNKISLKELDENIEKQNKITELENDIKKYFIITGWGYFSNKKRESKRKFLSLIKSIVKDMNVKMITSTLVKKLDDNITKCETFYIIEL
jgi:hypothetical protein